MQDNLYELLTSTWHKGPKDWPQHGAKRLDQTVAWLPPVLAMFLMVAPAPTLSVCSRKHNVAEPQSVHVPAHCAKPFSVILHLLPFCNFPFPRTLSVPFLFPPFHFPVISFLFSLCSAFKNLSYLCLSWSWAGFMPKSLSPPAGVWIESVLLPLTRAQHCFSLTLVSGPVYMELGSCHSTIISKRLSTLKINPLPLKLEKQVDTESHTYWSRDAHRNQCWSRKIWVVIDELLKAPNVRV